MPYMMETQSPEQVVSFQEAPSTGASSAVPSPSEMRYSIPRVGGRPLEFTGIELGMAMSYHPDMPWWYEFNLFRSETGVVLTVKRFHIAEDETDFCRAWTYPDLESAIAALEGYDPSQDIRVESYTTLAQATAAELAAAAMQLRAEIADTRAHFASLVGQFLHELDEVA